MTAEKSYYMYISTLGDWDPVKTIFVCGPAASCDSLEKAQKFARSSGWERLAEDNKCVLIVPVVKAGWDKESSDRLLSIYNEIKMKVPARQGRSIWGRGGTLWCWEIILYAAGYGDGAEYVGRCQITHPNMFAAVALAGQAPADLSAGSLPSDHWFVKTVSDDYAVRNCEVPVHTWIYTDEKTLDSEQMNAYVCYLNQVNHATEAQEESVNDLEAMVYYGSENDVNNPAHQVRIFNGNFSYDKALAEHMLHECFDHVVRWKNGPDGTLALVDSREEFYRNPRYLRRSVGYMGNIYDYFIHFPAGKTAEEVQGLPLVISVHGRGEPAWMFTDKNGWETLADETGEFVTISPDSPGNIWFWSRDAHVFEKMIDQMAEEFGIDRSRVYLTGFSNGGSITREVSALYPKLFAAISPWNGPAIDSSEMPLVNTSRLPNHLSDGMKNALEEMAVSRIGLPAFIIYGDRDMGISVESNLCMPYYVRTNQCDTIAQGDHPVGYATTEVRDQKNYYTTAAGYHHGDRFTTYVYRDCEGLEKICITIMKNMPHGAIREESRAAWTFMKKYQRVEDKICLREGE